MAGTVVDSPGWRFLQKTDANPAVFRRTARNLGCGRYELLMRYADAANDERTNEYACADSRTTPRKLRCNLYTVAFINDIPRIGCADNRPYKLFYSQTPSARARGEYEIVPTISGMTLMHPEGYPENHHERVLAAFLQSNIEWLKSPDRDGKRPRADVRVVLQYDGRVWGPSDARTIENLALGYPSSVIMPIPLFPIMDKALSTASYRQRFPLRLVPPIDDSAKPF